MRAGVAEAQKRADEKAGTDRALGAQLRDKAVRSCLSCASFVYFF